MEKVKKNVEKMGIHPFIYKGWEERTAFLNSAFHTNVGAQIQQRDNSCFFLARTNNCLGCPMNDLYVYFECMVNIFSSLETKIEIWINRIHLDKIWINVLFWLIKCLTFWLLYINSPLHSTLYDSSYTFKVPSVQFSSVTQPCPTLRPHESQHARPPCPSPTPRVYSNPCPLGQWCHPTISSSVVPFFSCPQSIPASGSFPMSQLISWGGQSIGVSASASVLPITQDWSPSLQP